ncbi:MAG: RNA polymerase sigma-70 factor (ECF subfamily) [Cryomorphaceae bacterium]|jgi:RNA polymerase sigma-70 factor (ECF subfamily)
MSIFKKRKDPESLSAFIKLLTEYQGDLRAFIVSLMPGSSDVPDVLQETNVVLWNKRDSFELGTNFIAWSFQIARYEVHRHRDKIRRDQRIMFSDELVSLLSDDGPSSIGDDELHAALDICLGKLTVSQSELIKERYTPGHSLEDYASRNGRSAGSLRIALLRIRESLKRCVEKNLISESK